MWLRFPIPRGGKVERRPMVLDFRPDSEEVSCYPERPQRLILIGTPFTPGSKMGDTAEVSTSKNVFEPALEEGVFRVDYSTDDRIKALPTVSFVNPKDRDTPTMSNHKIRSYTPTFEYVAAQQIVTFELQRTRKRVRFYLELFAFITYLWTVIRNAINYRFLPGTLMYGIGTTSLYQSHPWVLALLHNGEALGFLADTTKCCQIHLRKNQQQK